MESHDDPSSSDFIFILKQFFKVLFMKILFLILAHDDFGGGGWKKIKK